MDDPPLLSGVVVDLSWAASRSTHLGVADVLRWEERHGRVPAGAVVLLRTGWHRHFRQPDKFLGHFADENRQVFPGEDKATGTRNLIGAARLNAFPGKLKSEMRQIDFIRDRGPFPFGKFGTAQLTISR